MTDLDEKRLAAAVTAWLESASNYTRLRESVAAAIRAYEAAKGVGEPVAIKLLEWEEITSPREDGPSESTGDLEAASAVGVYSIVFDICDDVSDTPWCCWTPEENQGHFTTVDEAKAAAQADYDTRIRSALVTAPQPSQSRDDLSGLLGVIADIREKTGVGAKPMLFELADAVAALSASLQREGWVLVPVEPTEAMATAGAEGYYDDTMGDEAVGPKQAAAIYRAMLAVAPKEG